MIARRLGRKIDSSQELLLQWRREPHRKIVERRREGIVTPLTYYRGRDLGQVLTFLTNPVFLLINPAYECEDEGEESKLIDVASGDLFVRLKYFNGDKTTDKDAVKATHHVITVHDSEEQFNTLQILGNLEG